jgi:aspartate dehydrogenase
MAANRKMSVGIGGFGAIGMAVARALDGGSIPGMQLAAVSANDKPAAVARMKDYMSPAPVMGLAALANTSDVVIECAPSAVFREVAEAAIEKGRIFMPLSCGQLLDHMDLVVLAEKTGARIVVPTGALLGLDAVRGAAEGEIESVTMVTRKPPNGLQGAPHLVDNDIDVSDLSEPLMVFDGSARGAVKGFPANVNVAVALSLAGIGPDRTTIQVWADPGVTRNTHTIKVEADSVRFEMTIENVPSVENPRTGALTPLSTIAALRGLVQPLKVGT